MGRLFTIWLLQILLKMNYTFLCVKLITSK